MKSAIPARAYPVIPARAYSVIPAKAGIHYTIYRATLHPGTQGADIYTALSCCINNSLAMLNR